jgi:hypothetical protein
MLARIRTNSPSEVSQIADALRKRGYEVEIVPANFEAHAAAELEIAAESFPAQEALAQARGLADELKCDLLIAPGALDSIRIVEPEAEHQVPFAEAQQAAVPPAVADAAIEQVAQVAEEKGPDWTQRALDRCAVVLAQLRGLAEEIPGVVQRVSSRGWDVCRRGSIWAAGKMRIGATKLGVASRGAAVTAGARLGEARQQYAQVRAAATAKAAQMREERRQAKAAAKAHIAVEVLETTAPLPQASRGWRPALAGAAMAALVIGVGFSVGAGRTPAATPNLTSPSTTAALASMSKVSTPVSAAAVKPKATRLPSTAARAKRRFPAETDDTEQEVIVRHFAPVKSTPAVSADGVHHYSDTDQR